MSTIIFDPLRCAKEVEPYLFKPWKVQKIEVDRQQANGIATVFQPLLTISGIPGKVKLIDTISVDFFPPAAPLCPNSGRWRLQSFLNDPEYRKGCIFEAVDAVFQLFTVTTSQPDSGEIRELKLHTVNTFEDLQRVSFSLAVQIATHNARTNNVTEQIPLRHVMTKTQLEDLWEKVSRPQTYRDLPSFL